MHELEEAEVQRQLLLRDSPVGPQPRSQQRPEPLHRVDVHLAEPVAVLVAGVLAVGVADRPVHVAPRGQPVVDIIFIGVDLRPLGDRRADQGTDRRLLDVGQHPDHDLPAALDHAEDGWLLLLQSPSAPVAFQAPASARPPFFATASGWPLCPATT